MSARTVTLDIPTKIYEQIEHAAEKNHRKVNDLLVEAAVAVAPVIDTNSFDLQTALAQLAYLNDAALWQAARASLSTVQRERLAWLNDKQQREGLTQIEQEEADLLLKLYRETLVIRAQATVLLQQRNYDVSDPSQFHPLN